MSRTKQFVLIVIALTAMNASAQVGEGIHQVGECYVGGTYVHQAVEIAGDVMYATNHYGIEIWDLGDPANPELTRTMPFRRPIMGYGIETFMGSISRPQIIIRDNLMIIGTHIYLWIFDISDPINPELLSETQGSIYFWTTQMRTTWVYYTSFSEMLLIDNTLVTFNSGNCLSSIDISNPADPQFVDEVILLANENAICGSAQIVEHEGQILAVGALYSEEFAIITFNLVESEFELVADAHFEAPFHPMLDNQSEVVVHGDELIYSFMDDDAHLLHGINISDPEQPEFIGTVDLEIETIYLYLFNPLLKLKGDILYYYHPYLCGIVNLENGFEELTLAGDFPFFELDIEDRWFTPDLVWDIALGEEVLYTIHKFGTLKAFDISDPGDVSVLFDNSEDPAYSGRQIVVQFDRKDDVIYCGALSAFANATLFSNPHSGCASLISITEPTRPELINEDLMAESTPYVTSAYAYIQEETNRLVIDWYRHPDGPQSTRWFTIFDLEDPLHPRRLNQFRSPFTWFYCLVDIQQDKAVLFNTRRAELQTAVIEDLENVERLNFTFLDSLPYDEQRHFPAGNIFVDANELFLSGSGWENNPEIYRFDIEGALNTENPTDPELAECFDLSSLIDSLDVVFALEVQDTIAYAITGRQILNGRAMCPWSQKLVITNRQFEGLYSETELFNSGGPMISSDRPYRWQIKVRDNLAYLLSHINGLYVYDVSDINRPAELVGWYDTPGEANQISFVDSLILIADTWSLQILQLGDAPEHAAGHSEGIVPDDFSITAVYPNPFNGMFTVAVEVPHPGAIGFTVFNITGRIITNSVFTSSKAGSVEHSLDLSSQSSGIYIVRVSTQWGDKFRRVVLLK